MARKLEVDIKETTKELKQLLHQQKSVRIRERVEVLYQVLIVLNLIKIITS